ncbi:Polysaccharide biosynthesis tyrosine autokinase [Rhodovastum atsumiense]|nr:polysaccharide biosynthesis tyrosine autokinase [Rhodovastum atsumiense]CAH2604434.1 Polysaccharide biosynthesis tyrosine autokinase [Rhodovastum atsumiense]
MLHVPGGAASGPAPERRTRVAGGGDPPHLAAHAVSVVLSMLRRRIWAFVLCAVAIPVIAFVVLEQMAPRYTATGTAVYEPESYAAQELQSILRVDPMTDAVMASQAEIVRSQQATERLIDRFGLMNSQEFNWTLRPPSIFASAVQMLRDGLDTVLRPVLPALADLLLPAPRPPPNPVEVRQSVVRAVQNAMEVTVVRQSHVLNVSFTTEDRQLAADAVNAMLEYYIADQLALKFDAVRNATTWLQARADELRREVQLSEDKVTAYRTRTGLVQGVQAALDTEQVSRVSADLLQARNELAQAEGKLDAARGGRGAQAQAAVAPSVVQMRTQMDTLNAQLQSLTSRLGSRHPDVLSLRNQIADLRQSVGNETTRVVAASDAEVRAARARVASLEQNLKLAQAEYDRKAQSQLPLNAMDRDLQASRTLLQTVLARIQQTQQQNAIEKPDARVISSALVPAEPSFPRMKILMPAAAVFGILFGLLVVYLLDVSDSTLRSGDDVRAVLGLPCFALIPQVRARLLGRARLEDYVVRKPHSSFAEQIRALRAGLWLDNGNPRIIAITAARPGEAKTTTAIALGRSAALNNERVLVLDCDIRQPSFGRIMRAEHGLGIADLLLGQATLEEVIRRDRLTDMDFIPAGSNRVNSLGLFMSDAMSRAMEYVRGRYDLVLLDAPPVFAMTDARIISRCADATLLCVRWRETPRSVVSRSLDLLDEADARVIGVVMTRVDPRAHVRGGHTDSEVYHPRYGGYYRD